MKCINCGKETKNIFYPNSKDKFAKCNGCLCHHKQISGSGLCLKCGYNTKHLTNNELLEYYRGEIRAERISYQEIIELQNLCSLIRKDDIELLEWAGIEEEKISKLRDEFFMLRNDDPNFEKQYKENEFEEWLKDNDIKI